MRNCCYWFADWLENCYINLFRTFSFWSLCLLMTHVYFVIQLSEEKGRFVLISSTLFTVVVFLQVNKTNLFLIFLHCLILISYLLVSTNFLFL